MAIEFESLAAPAEDPRQAVSIVVSGVAGSGHYIVARAIKDALVAAGFTGVVYSEPYPDITPARQAGLLKAIAPYRDVTVLAVGRL